MAEKRKKNRDFCLKYNFNPFAKNEKTEEG